MFKEEYLQHLLKALYDKGSLNIYDHNAAVFTTLSDEFANTKSWADQLARDKLAAYSDPEHTVMQLTNFGKYWMIKGGYESFLKEGQSTKDHHKINDDPKVNLLRKEKEELIEARLKLTHYRLTGFWLTIVISSLGFLLSLYNLYMFMKGKK
ncbi:MAG: hypothetical protein ACXWWC_03885 [Chitinophagaceae bacterium]